MNEESVKRGAVFKGGGGGESKGLVKGLAKGRWGGGGGASMVLIRTARRRRPTPYPKQTIGKAAATVELLPAHSYLRITALIVVVGSWPWPQAGCGSIFTYVP